MLHRFLEFSLDRIFESLILESKLEFSDEFKDILDMIPRDNKIRNLLLSSRGSGDFPLTQNYIDVSNNKEEVTFIQDRRAQQMFRDIPPVWKTNNRLPGSKFLTFNKSEDGDYKNESLFRKLGFTPQEPTSENHPVPGPGVTGVIISETISNKSGKTYVLFQWEDEGKKNLICLNKEALNQESEVEEMLYKQSRNPIRIGRLVNSLMNAIKQPVTQREVEEFANIYKSAYDILNDAFMKFDVVSGYEIARWYDESSYESNDSTLGSSCMRYDECSSYFGIYTDNSGVCQLVILYSDKGSIVDGKFKSNFIKGRALLWKTNQGDMFMDRIYTNNDSDVELFKQFAEKNGWWCKKAQNSSCNFTAQKGNAFKDPTYSVDLRWANQDYYPYVDTLAYLTIDPDGEAGVISNDSDVINAEFYLRDTEGSRDDV